MRQVLTIFGLMAIAWILAQPVYAQAAPETGERVNPAAERTGPIWLSTEVTTLANGVRFIDAKRYSELFNGRGVEVENFRLLEDGQVRPYLRGIYAWDGAQRTTAHWALFNNGGIVRNAAYDPASIEAGRPVMTFEFVMPGSTVVMDWRSTEYFTPDGLLVEQAEMRNADGGWDDMGVTYYRSFDAAEDAETLAVYFAEILAASETNANE